VRGAAGERVGTEEGGGEGGREGGVHLSASDTCSSHGTLFSSSSNSKCRKSALLSARKELKAPWPSRRAQELGSQGEGGTVAPKLWLWS